MRYFVDSVGRDDGTLLGTSVGSFVGDFDGLPDMAFNTGLFLYCTVQKKGSYF